MLTDIRALADHFLIALLNINKHFWRRCRGERRFAEITLSLTSSWYLYFYLFLSFYILYFLYSYLMENQDFKSIYQFATPSETDLLPWESSQPIQTSQCRLSSRLIAMIQNLSFSRKEDKFILEILSKHVIVFALKAFLIKHYVGRFSFFFKGRS